MLPVCVVNNSIENHPSFIQGSLLHYCSRIIKNSGGVFFCFSSPIYFILILIFLIVSSATACFDRAQESQNLFFFLSLVKEKGKEEDRLSVLDVKAAVLIRRSDALQSHNSISSFHFALVVVFF